MGQPNIQVFGRQFDLAMPILADKRCACGRTAECAGFRIEDGNFIMPNGDVLEHACWDVTNASGNAHRDKVRGGWWVEWHFDFCYDRVEHCTQGAHPPWWECGISRDEYLGYLSTLTPQESANGNRREHPKRKHAYFPVHSDELVLLQPEMISHFSAQEGKPLEQVREEICDMLALLMASRATLRSLLVLNHEIPETYYSNAMLRMWPGEEHKLSTLQLQPAHTVRLLRDGKPVELETGSLPKLRAFLGKPALQLKDPKKTLLEEKNDDRTRTPVDGSVVEAEFTEVDA